MSIRCQSHALIPRGEPCFQLKDPSLERRPGMNLPSSPETALQNTVPACSAEKPLTWGHTRDGGAGGRVLGRLLKTTLHKGPFMTLYFNLISMRFPICFPHNTEPRAPSNLSALPAKGKGSADKSLSLKRM